VRPRAYPQEEIDSSCLDINKDAGSILANFLQAKDEQVRNRVTRNTSVGTEHNTHAAYNNQIVSIS